MGRTGELAEASGLPAASPTLRTNLRGPSSRSSSSSASAGSTTTHSRSTSPFRCTSSSDLEVSSNAVDDDDRESRSHERRVASSRSPFGHAHTFLTQLSLVHSALKVFPSRCSPTTSSRVAGILCLKSSPSSSSLQASSSPLSQLLLDAESSGKSPPPPSSLIRRSSSASTCGISSGSFSSPQPFSSLR